MSATVDCTHDDVSQLGKLVPSKAGKTETAGEFSKLSKAYSDSKPGKIAYALAYKATLAP
jgi:hypothetical protein